MELMNLMSVKKYLRIDFDGDDEILEIIMQAAADYIKSAVGDFNAEDPRVKLLFLNITASNTRSSVCRYDKWRSCPG